MCASLEEFNLTQTGKNYTQNVMRRTLVHMDANSSQQKSCCDIIQRVTMEKLVLATIWYLED